MTGPVIPRVAWEDVVGQLRTGDVLFFSGDNSLDEVIQLVEGEPYTHVGLVINNGSDLWFWDAPGGGDTFPDPVSGNSNQKGARVAYLDKIVPYYMGTGGELNMWWSQLVPGVTPAQQSVLMNFVKTADGTPFPGETDPLPPPWNVGVGFMESWIMGVTLKKPVIGSYFCAQLAAASYMAMGLLPTGPYPDNAYDPANFSSADPSKLPLIGVSLTATQQVIYTPPGG